MVNPPIDWTGVRAAIFDVDGTLYDARKLRRRMLAALLGDCLAHPSRLPQLRVLQTYRRERERLSDAEAPDILTLQYDRPARRLGIEPAAVETVVDHWIHQRPLPFLRACRIAGAGRFFDWLRDTGRQIAVLSDYPARAKLDALELTADVVVCGTDADVNRLKPHPAGLEKLLTRLDAEPSACLLLGDRESRDGAVARRVGVPYLLRTAALDPSGTTFRDFRELLAGVSEPSRRAL